jgi:hypothetical protein
MAHAALRAARGHRLREQLQQVPRRYDSPRGYFVLSSAAAEGRSEVGEFTAWLREEAARANATGDDGASVAAASADAGAAANAGASRNPSPKAKGRRSGTAGR